MPDSRWSGQKTDASTFVKNALASGQEKTLQELIDGLKGIGVARKNALKAIYSEVQDGNAILASGDWNDGRIKKGGA
jgi:hypothetical protein